jgi:hypothetical protein
VPCFGVAPCLLYGRTDATELAASLHNWFTHISIIATCVLTCCCVIYGPSGLVSFGFAVMPLVRSTLHTLSAFTMQARRIALHKSLSTAPDLKILFGDLRMKLACQTPVVKSRSQSWFKHDFGWVSNVQAPLCQTRMVKNNTLEACPIKHSCVGPHMT